MIRSIALILVPLLTGAAAPAPDPPYDIVIRGGRVLDGEGNHWVAADVAIADGRIVRVGVVDGAGKQENDARGTYVSPGFNDMPPHLETVLQRSEERRRDKEMVG